MSAASRSARSVVRSAALVSRSTAAEHRSTRMPGACISRSAGPASSLTRSASHSRSSTTRTSARLPADSPTGRKSAPRKLSRSASIASTTSSRVALPSRRSASAATALAACLRNSPWWRGGSKNSAAGTQTASAIAQPEQPLVDRAGRRACGQHERQQRGSLARRDRLAEHAREHHRHAEHEHQRDGQPGVRRHQGAQSDEDRAVDARAPRRPPRGSGGCRESSPAPAARTNRRA